MLVRAYSLAQSAASGTQLSGLYGGYAVTLEFDNAGKRISAFATGLANSAIYVFGGQARSSGIFFFWRVTRILVETVIAARGCPWIFYFFTSNVPGAFLFGGEAQVVLRGHRETRLLTASPAPRGDSLRGL